jgi:ADP-ribose pyrophosphatase YjhB (NUDIX family)
MLFNRNGEILLIRNSYGATHLFVLPGGGVRPWERPARAAHREVREEIGCSIEELKPVSVHFTSAEGKRDTVHLFEGRLVSTLKIDASEIAEARFFPLHSIPESVSPATARRLAERDGRKKLDTAW